jgi:hypothetical protein
MNSKLQRFYQRHLLAEALCGHSLWRDIQHAAGELPGPIASCKAIRNNSGFASSFAAFLERIGF